MARSHMRCGPWLLLQASMLLRANAWSAQPPMYDIPTGDGQKHLSLYSKDGPVEVLIGLPAFNLIHQDPNVVWIVEYYDQGCPHCWYFSGLYPSVAKAIKSPTVRVGAFNCIDPANQAVCKDVLFFPQLIVYNLEAAGAKQHRIKIHKGSDIDQDLRPKDIAAKLSQESNGRVTILHPDVFPPPSTAALNLVDPRGPPGKDGWTDEGIGAVASRFHDAHIGMGLLLMDGYTSWTKYEAALDVVQFIGRAYGQDEQKVFADLLTKLQATPSMAPTAFKATMHEWMQQFNSKLVFCKTKTCSVWQLFHSVSALIAIHYAPINVAEALPKFRFIVDNFLDCEVCREHFVQSYDACLFARCDVLVNQDPDLQAKALVMWLWRTHNAVNQRVISESPPKNGPAIDRRWPAYHECVGCWKVSVVNGKPAELQAYTGQTNNDQPVYAVFDEEKVFGFILKSYLGQDATSRLFDEIPAWSLPRHRDAADSPHSVIWAGSTQLIMIFACVIASVATLFAVWRSGHKLRETSPVLADEQELLETSQIIE